MGAVGAFNAGVVDNVTDESEDGEEKQGGQVRESVNCKVHAAPLPLNPAARECQNLVTVIISLPW